MNLVIQRRHKRTCSDRALGPNYLKCKGKCALWAYGCEEGQKVYFSLKTRDIARANRKLLDEREKNRPKEPARKTVADTIADFLEDKANLQPETLRKYRRILDTLQHFCDHQGIKHLPDCTIEALDAYKQKHRADTVVWLKHVEVLRNFFRFALLRRWTQDNPPAQWKAPKIPDRREIVPYTREEVTQIIAACDRVGRRSYERLRARAMILLLRFTGMRISDVVTLSRDQLQDGYIVKRAIKNKRWLRIELPTVVLQALRSLPHPEAAARDSAAFFAGQGSTRSLVKGAERLLWSVFRISGVTGAFPHRFRHTFASELLAKGAPIEVVADLLGDSVAVVRKHYQKWMPQWQDKKDQASRELSDLPQTFHKSSFSRRSH